MDRAGAAFDAGRFQEALDYYDEAYRLDPGDDAILMARGSTLVKLDRCEEAISDLDAFVDRLDFVDVLADLGVLTDRAYCNMLLENYEAAAADLELQVQYTPDDDWSWTVLGRAYHFLMRYDEGEAAFKKAIALKPGDAWPNYQLALLYLVAGRDAEAVPYLRTTLRLEPDNSDAAQLLAEAERNSRTSPAVATAAVAAPIVAALPVVTAASAEQLLATCRSYDVARDDAARACFTLAGYRTSGTGIERNRAAADWLYSRACDFGVAKACLITGINYELGRTGEKGSAPPNHGAAVTYYRIACERDASLCGEEAVQRATRELKTLDPD